MKFPCSKTHLANMATTNIDKETRFEMISRVQKQVFNMDDELTRKLFDEDQELELHLFRAIKNLLKNDSGLTEKLYADIQNQQRKRQVNTQTTPDTSYMENVTL